MCVAKARKETITTDTKRKTTWVESLNARLSLATRSSAASSARAMRTTLRAHVDTERKALYVPAEMPSLQRRGLRYLAAFARSNDFRLVEDRRRFRISPPLERRDDSPPAIALGLALLMKQAGLPGPAAELSRPHRLRGGNSAIELPDLLRMAALARPHAKRIVALPNKPLVDVLHDNTHPITGYGCRIDTTAGKTLLTHFDSQGLRAVGYSTGDQYVMHVLLAGGPRDEPTLWADPHTLMRTDIRFRLFPGQKPSEDVGLLYSSFYFDMAKQRPAPWWLTQTNALGREEAPMLESA